MQEQDVQFLDFVTKALVDNPKDVKINRGRDGRASDAGRQLG